MNADDLQPGDVIAGPNGAEVTILRERESWQDRFGRDMFRYWARRADTGAEGWMPYGPAGKVALIRSGRAA